MNDSQQVYHIGSAEKMESFAGRIAKVCYAQPIILLLKGDLGAGKTTFARGFLRAAGYKGTVKSPTFSLLETYDLMPYPIAHFDLYRLKSPAELEGLGWADFFNGRQTCLIEWPEKAAEQLTVFDISCVFAVVEGGRTVQLEAHSQLGKEILAKMAVEQEGDPI